MGDSIFKPWGILFFNANRIILHSKLDFLIKSCFLIKNRNPLFGAWKVRPAPSIPVYNDEKKTTHAEPTSIIVNGGQGAILE